MSTAAILLPCAALVLLTVVIALLMYWRRVAELRGRRISPQRVADSRGAAEVFQDLRASDNYRNLLELPVLFYALCLAVAVSDSTSPFYVAGAWLFVALRVLHSAVHVTYNRVMHRLRAFSAGMLVLAILWAGLAVDLLQKR